MWVLGEGIAGNMEGGNVRSGAEEEDHAVLKIRLGESRVGKTGWARRTRGHEGSGLWRRR